LYLEPFVASLSVTILAEFGDKTQLAIVALATRHDRLAVMLGSLSAFALVDGLTIVMGEIIATLFPSDLLPIASGLVFIAMGLYFVVTRDYGEVVVKRGKVAFLSSFATISAMELGDKTQLVLVALAARYQAITEVFSGMMLGFLLLTAAALLVGRVLSERVSLRYLRIGSAVLFMAFGLLSIAGPVLGVGPL